eukprot:1146208-Pelagomonas_calceolata.AAC.7
MQAFNKYKTSCNEQVRLVRKGNLKKVQRLDCSNNLLARIPPSMGHLKFLKEFGLRYNSLDDRYVWVAMVICKMETVWTFSYLGTYLLVSASTVVDDMGPDVMFNSLSGHVQTGMYKAQVDKGLSRLLQFLREEEERERLEEIERLKPIGTPVGSYLEYRCKVEVGHVHKTEHGDIMLDNRCWIRSGHTLTQERTCTHIKELQGSVGIPDQEWAYAPASKLQGEWSERAVAGPRCRHCLLHHVVRNELCFAVEDLCEVVFRSGGPWWAVDNMLIIFGGQVAKDGTTSNDLFWMTLDRMEWHLHPTKGDKPQPR